MCVSLSFHIQMDLSTCVWFIPPTNGYICNTTCVWFDHSTYKWTYPQNHMCVILSFHLQMDLSAKPHVCDFIIPPTNGLIHKTTCVWFYHFTYKWTYPQNHMCVIWSFHLQMDLSTIPHVCDFIIPPTNGLTHKTTCVWFYHFTYKWTYPQYHVCVILSFHLQMDLSTFVWFIPPTNGHIHNTTCIWFYYSTYKWTYPQYHVCDFIIPPTNGLIYKTTCVWVYHSTYKWTYPHVCEFIIPPTNGYICNTTCVWFDHSTYKWTYPQNHMCVILSFHLQMDISTIPRVCDFIISLTNGHIHNTTCVWFYYSTYKWTYPQYHVCDFIIPPTNGLIHMCVTLSFHLQMNISTIPHVCDFIILPTNGHIHNTTCVLIIISLTNGLIHICAIHSTYKWTYSQYHICVILLFHLQMDISTIPHVWFYHSTYKWTYPHVCEFIIPPTNGHIHNTTCVWFYHSTYKWTYPQYHVCVILFLF